MTNKYKNFPANFCRVDHSISQQGKFACAEGSCFIAVGLCLRGMESPRLDQHRNVSWIVV